MKNVVTKLVAWQLSQLCGPLLWRENTRVQTDTEYQIPFLIKRKHGILSLQALDPAAENASDELKPVIHPTHEEIMFLICKTHDWRNTYLNSHFSDFSDSKD
jgi:hypothetical protein